MPSSPGYLWQPERAHSRLPPIYDPIHTQQAMDGRQQVPEDQQGSWDLVDSPELRPGNTAWSQILAVVIIGVVIVAILVFKPMGSADNGRVLGDYRVVVNDVQASGRRVRVHLSATYLGPWDRDTGVSLELDVQLDDGTNARGIWPWDVQCPSPSTLDVTPVVKGGTVTGTLCAQAPEGRTIVKAEILPVYVGYVPPDQIMEICGSQRTGSCNAARARSSGCPSSET